MAVIIKGTVKITRPIVPTDIAGLQLWLDASDSTTLFQNSDGTTPAIADSDPIGYWGDKSGNGKNATQSNSTKKPLLKLALQNGKNVVKADGINDLITTSTGIVVAQPFDYYIVLKFNSINTTDRVICGGNDAGNLDGTTLPGWNVYSFALLTGGTRSASTTLVSVRYNSTSSILRANGNQILTGNAGTGVPTTISLFGNVAGNDPGDLQICEYLLYNSALSDANRNLVESYLNTKWGVY